MARALEELVMDELDVLYQGALFLSGGSRRSAESLIDETAVAAYHAGVASAGELEPNPLERLLIRRFVAVSDGSGGDAAPAVKDARRGESVGPISAEGLYRAAGAVPPLARAALWLVLIRRWSYEAAAALLGVDVEGLKRLLAYRDAFMSAVMSSGGAEARRVVE
ncbi:MAG: hypothetical protein RQ751_03420 [Longimicrobiales bacterium]|nr:hypothetical protein [Longimicrobiales bacterium]